MFYDLVLIIIDLSFVFWGYEIPFCMVAVVLAGRLRSEFSPLLSLWFHFSNYFIHHFAFVSDPVFRLRVDVANDVLLYHMWYVCGQVTKYDIWHIFEGHQLYIYGGCVKYFASSFVFFFLLSHFSYSVLSIFCNIPISKGYNPTVYMTYALLCFYNFCLRHLLILDFLAHISLC